MLASPSSDFVVLEGWSIPGLKTASVLGVSPRFWPHCRPHFRCYSPEAVDLSSTQTWGTKLSLPAVPAPSQGVKTMQDSWCGIISPRGVWSTPARGPRTQGLGSITSSYKLKGFVLEFYFFGSRHCYNECEILAWKILREYSGAFVG